MSDTARTAFLGAAALHLGFQLTVSVLVYPALSRVDDQHWREEHRRHSRAITPLVGVVYALLVLTGVWVLATGPSAVALVAVVAAGFSLLVTATLAAPTHGKLTDHDPELVRRLLLVDRLRTLGALLSVVAAAFAALA